MTISLFVGIAFSLMAIFSAILDRAFHSIPLRTVFLISIVSSWILHRRWKKQFRNDTPGQTGLTVVCAGAIFLYLVSGSLWHFLPAGLGWDGANHVFIATSIADHNNHYSMVEDQPRLANLSDNWTYPWGFHAGVAAVANFFSSEPIRVIFPIAMLGLSLAMASLIVWSLWRGIHWIALLSCGVFSLIFKIWTYPILIHNYWTQAFGFLLCVGIFVLLELSDRIDWILLGILIGGILLIYPLYIFAIGPGLLIYAFLKGKKEVFMIGYSLFLGGLLSLPMMLPLFNRNLARFTESGPRLWGGFWYSTDRVIVLLMLAALPGAYRLIVKEKSTVYVLAVSSFLGMIPIFIFDASQYWIWKLNIYILFMMMPALAKSLDIFFVRPLLRPLNTKTLVQTSILSGVLLALLSYLPWGFAWRIKPALTTEDLQFHRWMKEKHPGARAFYLSNIKKIPWLQAVSMTPTIVVSENMIKRLRKWDMPMGHRMFFWYFQEAAKPGDLLCVYRRRIPLPKEHAEFLDRFGYWEIFRWK